MESCVNGEMYNSDVVYNINGAVRDVKCFRIIRIDYIDWNICDNLESNIERLIKNWLKVN